MTKKTLLACTTAMAAFGAVPAQAQDSDADIIVTAQRNNQTQVAGEGDLGVFGDKKAEDVPFQVRSYNEALILNQQPQTLGQVLENDPTIRTSFGFGNASEVFVIRGFPTFGDDVGLNGLYGIAPRQLVAPELFQSVQVLNGASAFINGAAPGGSSVGGSVNLQLKRAGQDPLNRLTLGYTSDSHFGGSFDVSRRLGENGEFGVRVNGAFRSGDVSIDNEFRRTTVIGGAFDWDGGNVRVSVDAAYQRVEVDQLRHKVTIFSNAIPKPPKSDHNFAQPWTYSNMRDIFGVARLEYDVADNALFYVSGGARDGSENGIYGGINLFDAATGDGSGHGLYVPRTDNNESVESGLRVKLGTVVTHEINVGANINWQTNRNAFDFLYGLPVPPDGPAFPGFPTNIYDTVDAPLPESSLVGGDLDNPFPIEKNTLWSVFVSDTVGFWNDRILVTGGMRLQNVRAKTFDPYNNGALLTDSDEDAITPVVGIVIKPTEGVSLYANRIEALQPGKVAPPGTVNAGQAFAPYRSTQYEIGGKAHFGAFDASVSLFQIENPSTFTEPNPDNLNAPGTFGVFGEQRNRGVELNLAAQPVDGLRVIAGFSAIDAKLRKTLKGVNDGNKAKGVPDFTANANVEWDLAFVRGLTLTSRGVYTGEQQVNNANTLKIGDWWRLDLGARYVFLAADKPVTLRFGVDNVTNERYWASAFDAFEDALLQGNPRTFKASASIDF
jgi:iron complex outermembrane receptor protein